MITKIHKHLPTNRWSITQKGVVVGYADQCTLINVTQHITPSIKAKHPHKRTVHLWCNGTLTAVVGFTPLKGREVSIVDGLAVGRVQDVVRYNPFRDDTLVYQDNGAPYTGSYAAVFEENGLMTV